MEQCGGLAEWRGGWLALCCELSVRPPNYPSSTGSHRRRSPNGVEVVCCRTVTSRHGSTCVGHRAGDPRTPVNLPTCKWVPTRFIGRDWLDIRRRMSSASPTSRSLALCQRGRSGTTIPSKTCSSHSVSKTGKQYLISHYHGLIAVRPGGGFKPIAPSQHVAMPRRRIRETLGPHSNRFNSIVVKL